MDLIKRIGTQKKKFKLQFFIGKLKFSKYYPVKVYIVLRRGGHKVKSQQKIQMPEDRKLNFNKEILQLEVTLYFDEKENKYQQKPGQMDIVMLDSKNDKFLLGIVPFDVGYYANVGNQSIKEKKQIQQTPKECQGVIEFNVFIKYIGEGSESSFDKVADFFFGKSKQPESEKKVVSKKQINSKQKIQDDPKKSSVKDLSKTEAKKGINVDFYQIEGSRGQKQKNYVTTAKERDGSRQFIEDNQELAKNFYFEETSNPINKDKKNKKDKRRSGSGAKNDNRGKEDSQKLIIDRQSGKKEQNPKQKINSKKQLPSSNKQITNPILAHYEQEQKISELRAQLAKCQKNYGQVQYQLSDINHMNNVIRLHNDKLQKELAECKQQLRRKNQELEEQRTFDRKSQHVEGDKDLNQKIQSLQKQIKRIEKEKNQIIVQNSKLKEKHKQQLKKYQQLLEQRQSNQQTETDSFKADVIKLRQECSEYRTTIQKLTKEKNDKNQQLIKQKTENKTMQEQLTQVKTNLSKIKLKICSKLNEYLGKDDKLAIVQALTELNNDD